MHARPRARRFAWIASLAIAIVAATIPPADARTGSGRSGTRGSGVASRSSAAAARGSGTAARPPRGSVNSVAAGRATYGRGHWHGGWRYGHGGYPWHGHYHVGLYGYYPLFYPYYYPYYPPIAYGVWDRPGPSPAVVETAVSPRRAEVWVDGEYRGEARDYNGQWDRLWLEPGNHVIEIRRDGYRTLRQHVRLPTGGYHRIDVRLEKGEGIDPRSTEAFADAAEESVEPAPLEPARAEGADPAFLRFEIEPADAVVYIDGEFLARGDELGRLHGAIPVAPGRHVIEVVRPGYRSVRQVVEAVTEEPQGVRVELEPGDD
jgi:hypothetical protein